MCTHHRYYRGSGPISSGLSSLRHHTHTQKEGVQANAKENRKLSSKPLQSKGEGREAQSAWNAMLSAHAALLTPRLHAERHKIKFHTLGSFTVISYARFYFMPPNSVTGTSIACSRKCSSSFDSLQWLRAITTQFWVWTERPLRMKSRKRTEKWPCSGIPTKILTILKRPPRSSKK